MTNTTGPYPRLRVITDLAVTLALGGDCLADIALLRSEPGVYGLVASDATVSRTVDALAKDAPAALTAIDAARAAARSRAWGLAGTDSPDYGTNAKNPLIVDLDATLVASHSDKELARATFKRGFGFHPLCSFIDHGTEGTGEPLAMMLRPGNAGSNTAADHIVVIKGTLAQLPGHRSGTRPGRKVLIRIDGAGSTHAVLDWMTAQRLSYSVGFTLPSHTSDLLELIPEGVWAPAYDAHDAVRDGAWVAEPTDLLNLRGWPKGMRVIVRKERPHPGAQLTITSRRRAPHHRVRDQHPHRWPRHPTCRPRNPPPSPRPLRRPDPHRQRHRTPRSSALRLQAEPNLVRHCCPRRRDHRADGRCSP